MTNLKTDSITLYRDADDENVRREWMGEAAAKKPVRPQVTMRTPSILSRIWTFLNKPLW